MYDKYHVASGAVIGCAMMSGIKLLHPEIDDIVYGAGVFCTVLGSFIPNLDNQITMKGAESGLSTYIGSVFLKMYEATTFRKGMHSFWAAIIGAFLMWTLTGWRFQPAFWGFFLGYMSHLFMDAFTPFGVCFFPIPTWSYYAGLKWETSRMYPVEQINRHYTKLAHVRQRGISAMIVTGFVTMVLAGIAYGVPMLLTQIELL